MWLRFRKAELSSVAIRVLFGLPYGMSTLQVLTIETITEVLRAALLRLRLVEDGYEGGRRLDVCSVFYRVRGWVCLLCVI